VTKLCPSTKRGIFPRVGLRRGLAATGNSPEGAKKKSIPNKRVVKKMGKRF
jgi:hypothetical protein